jgi:acylphosphatase
MCSTVTMEKIKCYRVVVEGITSYAIQGINLREKVESFVRSNFNSKEVKKVTGKICNLKNGQVEIIFCGAKSDLNKMSQAE